VSESNDKNNEDKHLHPDDVTTVEKVWVIDWNNKFQRTSSEEKTDYMDALKIFNEKSKEGKNAILYEVQKSISNGKMLKRIPILNSSKYAERKKNLPHDQKEPDIKKKTGGVFSSRKSRFLILLVIVVAFIITLYVLNIMASGGAMSGHHVILGTMESNFVDVTNDDIVFL